VGGHPLLELEVGGEELQVVHVVVAVIEGIAAEGGGGCEGELTQKEKDEGGGCVQV
jgi:hypothetical protein